MEWVKQNWKFILGILLFVFAVIAVTYFFGETIATIFSAVSSIAYAVFNKKIASINKDMDAIYDNIASTKTDITASETRQEALIESINTKIKTLNEDDKLSISLKDKIHSMSDSDLLELLGG